MCANSLFTKICGIPYYNVSANSSILKSASASTSANLPQKKVCDRIVQNLGNFEIFGCRGMRNYANECAEICIQWGSEYRTSLVFEWSIVVWLLNGPLFECHLNTGLNLVQYSDHHLNTWPVFKWWSEYRTTIWIPDKWKFVIQMFPPFRCSLFRSPL